MKVVNLVSQVFFLLITVLFLIYFLTGYDSAFEADQNCHSYLSSYDNPSGNYGCDHDTLRHISGYFTSPMKVKNQQKLLRNLGTSFYKSIFL